MKKLHIFFLAAYSFALTGGQCAIAPAAPTQCINHQPPNLAHVKEQIIHYYRSGSYQQDVACIATQIKEYLLSELPRARAAGKKPAIVFDIDDSVLCTFEFNLKLNFCYNAEEFKKNEGKGDFPAIEPMLDVYRFARSLGIRTYFITGRKIGLKEATIANLKKVGYYPFDGIFFRPDAYDNQSRIPFKSQVRKSIEAQGNSILATIGDQISDLAGNFAKKGFKLPNPMYIIP